MQHGIKLKYYFFGYFEQAISINFTDIYNFTSIITLIIYVI